MTVVLYIAIFIMFLSVVLYAKTRKIIVSIMADMPKSMHFLLRGYLMLLLFFALAYVFYTVRFVLGAVGTSMTLLVTLILFFGSLFVLISIVLLNRLISDLLNERLNQTDPLTGVLNKAAMRRTAEQIEDKIPGTRAMLILDLDGFKGVNDKYGHIHGDEMIIACAKCIKDALRPEDVIARFGGDEFVILLNEVAPNGAERTAERLNIAIKKLCDEIYPDLSMSASIGVTYCIGEEDCYDKMLSRADTALYKAKDNGKNCFVVES